MPKEAATGSERRGRCWIREIIGSRRTYLCGPAEETAAVADVDVVVGEVEVDVEFEVEGRRCRLDRWAVVVDVDAS